MVFSLLPQHFTGSKLLVVVSSAKLIKSNLTINNMHTFTVYQRVFILNWSFIDVVSTCYQIKLV